MFSINTNLPSLIAQSSLKNSTLKLNTAIERMTTGFKINGAKDNAANYSIATDMSTKISAYQVAEDNVSIGLDLLNTAGGSLDLISDKLARLRALQEQAMNGTYGEQSLRAINAEAIALVNEIEREYNTAEYNGINLFKSDANSSLPVDTSDMIELSKYYYIDDKGLGTVEDSSYFDLLDEGGHSFAIYNNYDLQALLYAEAYGSKNSSNCFILQNDIDIPPTTVDKLFTLTGTLYTNGYKLNVPDNIDIGNIAENVVKNTDPIIDLQVGIYGDEMSKISIKTHFALPNISSLGQIGIDLDSDISANIDKVLDIINDKQTQFGATQNRLESALEGISTQYENLVSSRSTLKDADIAKVSSEYIKQQILQQASATLLATANQTPALALQLL